MHWPMALPSLLLYFPFRLIQSNKSEKIIFFFHSADLPLRHLQRNLIKTKMI